ncbi:TPA: hypothetical protein ENX78_08535 [Candidatus Poribacteria bacterium]|nr:hypothetical protein [Candidatus Poribacteria bacterium]
MSQQRFISTSYWDDGWVRKLSPNEKLFYLYLLTNTLTNIAGIYKILDDRIEFDCGFSKEEISRMWKKFSEAKKAIRYDDEWVILPAWPSHQKWEDRPKIKKGIISILKKLPEGVLEYARENGYKFDLSIVQQKEPKQEQGYDINNVSIPYGYDMKPYAYDTISYTYDTNYLDSDLDLDSDLERDIDLDAQSAEKIAPTQDIEVPYRMMNNDYNDDYLKIIFEAWKALGDKAIQPSSYIVYLNQHCPRDILPNIRGIHSSDVLKAIENYKQIICDTSGRYYIQNKIGIGAFFRNHLEKYLPKNFDPKNFIRFEQLEVEQRKKRDMEEIDRILAKEGI